LSDCVVSYSILQFLKSCPATSGRPFDLFVCVLFLFSICVHSRALTHTHTHLHTLTHTHTHSHTLTHTHTHSHTLTHSHTHSHTLTQHALFHVLQNGIAYTLTVITVATASGLSSPPSSPSNEVGSEKSMLKGRYFQICCFLVVLLLR
jgi:hypothetical protein